MANDTYMVVQDTNLGKFQSTVNDLLGRGWHLEGALLALVTPAGNILYIQSMYYVGALDHVQETDSNTGGC